jgi:hypothetical protein
MPRGPGKPANYNLDYSRFNKFDLEGLDGLDEEPTQAVPEAKPAEPDTRAGADGPGEIPVDMFKNLPGELREAFRLMAISKQTGDTKAQERANELAMKAIEKGGPEVQQRFQQEMLQQASKNPEARKEIEKTMNQAMSGGYPTSKTKSMSIDELQSGAKSVVGDMDSLRSQMEKGQKKAQKQMEALKKQQDDLEKLVHNGSPEDFFKFMHQQGLTEADMQRAFSGDEKHMENVVKQMLDKTDEAETDPTETEGLKKALECVDQLHNGLMGNDLPDDKAPESEPPKPEKKKVKAKSTPEASIAQHRVQYQKDDAGRITSVELRAELPGVEGMAGIELDVSERHLRLSTKAPAFVVNVGPFPVLVDATASRAKFSKKRQELTISIPAK